MSFKDIFVRLRKEKGLLQTQVAEKLGISVGQIKKYEKGVSTPSLSVLGKIATLFGVSTDIFVFDGGKGVAGEKLDPELLHRFELVSHLPDRERDALIIVIDSIIAKQRLREVIGA
ncbi:MAG: helix-turn-helix transcriptional regulator [Candidatus Riflebacteria bacterium]|nr:helix-turn-helix transcriptional regulator [Candidatus Riflebacteria bacterium]